MIAYGKPYNFNGAVYCNSNFCTQTINGSTHTLTFKTECQGYFDLFQNGYANVSGTATYSKAETSGTTICTYSFSAKSGQTLVFSTSNTVASYEVFGSAAKQSSVVQTQALNPNQYVYFTSHYGAITNSGTGYLTQGVAKSFPMDYTFGVTVNCTNFSSVLMPNPGNSGAGAVALCPDGTIIPIVVGTATDISRANLFIASHSTSNTGQVLTLTFN